MQRAGGGGAMTLVMGELDVGDEKGERARWPVGDPTYVSVDEAKEASASISEEDPEADIVAKVDVEGDFDDLVLLELFVLNGLLTRVEVLTLQSSCSEGTECILEDSDRIRDGDGAAGEWKESSHPDCRVYTDAKEPEVEMTGSAFTFLEINMSANSKHSTKGAVVDQPAATRLVLDVPQKPSA
jgi:hypothetical protein